MEVDHDHKVTPIDFEVKGQGNRDLEKKSFSPQLLKNACPQCIDFDIFTFEACRIHYLAMH
jgi:hypothetical protein